MKSRSIFALFFSLVLILSLSIPAFAAKGDTGDWEILAKSALLIDPDTEEIRDHVTVGGTQGTSEGNANENTGR